MTIYVIHSWKGTDQQDEILKQLSLISKQNIKIMALIDDLKAQNTALSTKVDEMQATIDAEQNDIAALLAINAQVVTDLTAQNEALTQQLAAGATPAQLQEVIDSNNAIITKIDAAKADIESTVPPAA
jgi:uncharacterized membrane-anchored protein YhcB (DUF1043 family)